MHNLDLYSKIEPLIGFYDEYEELYQIYLKQLSNFPINTILDVGCGNGSFLLHLQKLYDAKGIDISPKMVEVAKSKGVEVELKNLDEVDEQFDAIIAVADILNYLDSSSLSDFLENVYKNLRTGGVFICDINTLFGFEEVTAGSMNIDADNKFLSIDADFNDDVLVTQMTLFEKNGECYKKEQSTILQYYYEVADINSLTDLNLQKIKDIKLFGDEVDKTLLVFQKS